MYILFARAINTSTARALVLCLRRVIQTRFLNNQRAYFLRTVFYQPLENNNIANQIHGFTIDCGKFILSKVSVRAKYTR